MPQIIDATGRNANCELFDIAIGLGMGGFITKNLQIHGQFIHDGFPNWICDRAYVLDLCGWVKTLNQEQIEVVVTGDPILVDAFEVACSLGPANIMVDRIISSNADQSKSNSGFKSLDLIH